MIVVKLIALVSVVVCCIRETRSLCTRCSSAPDSTRLEILLRRLKFRLNRAMRQTRLMMDEELRRITSDFMVQNLEDTSIVETTSLLSTNMTEIFESDFRNLMRIETYWNDMMPTEIDGNEAENIEDAHRTICTTLTSLCHCMRRREPFPVEPKQLYAVRFGFTYSHPIYEHYVIARDTTRFLESLFNRYSEIENGYSVIELK